MRVRIWAAGSVDLRCVCFACVIGTLRSRPCRHRYCRKASRCESARLRRRVEAINRVDVRAKRKGYLETVLFKEGD